MRRVSIYLIDVSKEKNVSRDGSFLLGRFSELTIFSTEAKFIIFSLNFHIFCLN